MLGANIFNTVSYALFMYISSFLCGMAKIRIKTRKNMCKSEIFAKIINIVSKETEVSVDQILSSDKKMETVDARYLLVSLLFESGMYPSQIAVHIHKTKRAVNYMISNFHERIENGKMMRIYWDNIKNLLGNN